MSLKIHAICIALNEEDFITETIKPLYDHCSGISIVTQYDRDYYGKLIEPDETVKKVLNYPDPQGKIHLVARRYNDETASRNHEMKAIMYDASKSIQSHGTPIDQIRQFHATPDYFLIVDADEIYDSQTIGNIIAYLEHKKPRGMRVSAYEYGFSWQYRVPSNVYLHHQFGFIKAGILFTQRRVVTWNEFRLKNFYKKIGLNEKKAARLFGFIDCPLNIGMFHHAAFIRKNREKLLAKINSHSHPEVHDPGYIEKILTQDYEFIHKEMLPINIRTGDWPQEFWMNIQELSQVLGITRINTKH